MSTTLNVCDRVRYQGDNWRVCGHMRKEVFDMKSFGTDIFDTILREQLEDEQARRRASGLPCGRMARFIWCPPEEATHVTLYAICGTIAPIAECEKIGVVSWPADLIAQEQASAARMQNNNNRQQWRWE